MAKWHSNLEVSVTFTFFQMAVLFVQMFDVGILIRVGCYCYPFLM